MDPACTSTFGVVTARLDMGEAGISSGTGSIDKALGVKFRGRISVNRMTAFLAQWC